MSEVKTNKITSLASNNDITLDPDGTGDVLVASGHKLGVGTTSPTYQATVFGSSQSTVEIESGSDTGESRLYFTDPTSTGVGTVEYHHNGNTMRFQANGSERMRITPDGLGGVAIGGTDPDPTSDGTSTRAFLAVQGSGNRGCLALGTTSNAGGDVAALRFNNGSNVVASIGCDSDSGSTSAGSMGFFTNQTQRMSIASDGSIFTQGISGSASAMSNVKIDSSNELHKDTSARITKSEIADLHIGLDEVVALTPRKFKRGSNTAFEIGFIADEMASVAPEVVMRGPKSWITNVETDTEEIDISIEYDKLTALLTKAIQELKADLDAEKAKTATLQTQVADLITRVTALEAGE